MGLLSNFIKPNFLGLLKNLNSFNWFIVFFSLINLSVCIYEDQIGKFDWRQTYVGRIKFAQFDTVSTAKKIIVATEENVLAALNLKTGQVVWRHVFESTSTGNVQLLHVAEKVVTVTGSNPYLVRGWESTSGVLLWEWSLTLQRDDHAEFSEWWVQNGMLVHMLPMFGSHIEVTMYNLMTGQNRGSTSKLPAIWTNEGCVTSPPYYTCVSGSIGSQLLLSLDVTSNAVQIISKPLSQYIPEGTDSSLRPLDANSVQPGFIIGDKKIVLIKNNDFDVLSTAVVDQSASVALVDGVNGPIVLQTWTDDVKGFSLVGHLATTGVEVTEIRSSDKSLDVPEPEIVAALCVNAHACRILVSAADDSLRLMQQGGRVLWTREEALANVVAVEFVDLPVSDLDAAIESEFDQKEGSVWSAFTRRLQAQIQALARLAPSAPQTTADENALVRDYFNLHKIIVLVTDVGKIFGMDNLSGALLWELYVRDMDAHDVVMYIRRTAHHPPYDALLTIVAKHEDTGNGMIINLDPIRGTRIGEKIVLDKPLLQCALLHKADHERLHALILLDRDEQIQIFPQSAAPLVENMFMYVADKHTAKVQGYALRYDGKGVVSSRTWSVQLGGAAGHRVVSLAGKAHGERVVSPGRVMPDRSVLYKYSNPNLVLFVTQGPDALHKDIVVATCLDVVSGAIIASAATRRARALPLAVNSDNFVAYLYYNDKHRRTEIGALELYEGSSRWSSREFSSLASVRAAGGARAAYVVPAGATAAALTATARGLPDRHLLLALSTGAVVEVPWNAMSPRRGAVVADEPIPMAPPSPDIPIPPEAALTYNRTLRRVKALHTRPSGLESTCLVLATGLDIFYTRVAPSKTFDLLKDDFDYYLITVVLGALVVATYSTKYFASRKMLKMAWK